MSQRLTTILLIALVVSGFVTFLVYRAVTSRGTATLASSQVVAAARQLEIGALLADKDLKIVPWAGPVPKGMATKKDGLLNRGVVATIYEGEPVLESRLAEQGGGGGLAASIPPGMRAVALRVNDVVGASGFVLPGTHVDVLISGMPPGANAGGSRVKTLLQNVEVLSAGQDYRKDSEGKPVVVQVVNVLVTPAQAEILSLASNETHIQLVLRNPLDTQEAKTPGSMVASLYNGGVPELAPKPRPRPEIVKAVTVAPAVAVPLPPFRVEVLNGGQRSEASFPRGPEDKK